MKRIPHKKSTSTVKPASRLKVDSRLLLVIFLMLGAGLLMVGSASVAYGKIRFDDGYYFFKRQLLGVGIGLVAMAVTQAIPYRFWRKMSVPLFFAAVVLLVLVLIPGIGSTAYGAARWISLGPVSFQPSEVMKFALIVYLAAFFSGKTDVRKTDFIEGAIPFIVILGLIAFLIMKQPDAGTLGIMFVIAFSVFFASGTKISHLGILIGLGLVGIAGLIAAAPYRMHRLTVFLDPGHDPSGAGYQMKQALIALGSGGIFGVGLGHGRQKFLYLPEPMTDSIFAVIGEELGMFGCSVIVVLFLFFAYRGFHIARKAPDEFGKLLSVGIVSWVAFQAFVNIFAISGLMPLTGIPLPFISYGGTSVAVTLAAIGVLLNISKGSTMEE
ncbi:MAG: putative lipid II flippase FtsW [Candidatus Moranbacteria bacterium]|nr:putative lipid II flippase FtsW [Candidatus Moranbacteria bacterium]